MPYRNCPNCTKGLKGVEGHDAIVLLHYPPLDEKGGPTYRCMTCNTLWRRNYRGGGEFDWTPEATQPSSVGR